MNQNFSINLKRLRELRGYTQQTFADATGLKRNTIACYETERRECDFDTLLLFADILKCSTDELLKPYAESDKQETNFLVTDFPNTVNSEIKGYIYIMTNPSFEEYVKIGYADDVERRLNELNRSECVPYSFRIYATYAVTSRLLDKNVHSIIDRLNPDLRSVETVNGQKRVREFYAMDPEKAYNILEAIAEMHGCTERLVLNKPTVDEEREEKEAQDIVKESRTRSNNFTFSEWQIPVGAILQYRFDASITCKVVDERRVEYNGEIMYLTGVAKKRLGKATGVCGPDYFMYKGAKLWDIEGRINSTEKV
ncbi:MAG: GIY-YIG nuclease family protein [Clostridia bacterium]|nr:GIY-YIG nuclease family protein [Clostridia bacterium]